MQILAPSLRALVVVIGLNIFSAASAESLDPSAAAISAFPAPEVIANCDDRISECASQFEKIVTVYKHNATVVHVNTVTSDVTLPTSTIISTAVTIETRINKTETDALCEKTFVVTLPGTSTVTVHLNSTHINKIIPTTTTVTTSTITQYETQVSVCLVHGTHQFPLRPPRHGSAGGSPVAVAIPTPSAAAIKDDDEDSFVPDAGVEEVVLPDSEDEDRWMEHVDL